MISTIVTFAMNALMAALDPEKIRGFITEGARRVQDYVRGTESKLDDALIPAIDLVLHAIKVPSPNGEIDVTAELKKLFDILGDMKDLFIDAGLDYIEDEVIESENKIDDTVVLPLCNLVRKVLNVPDDDDDDNAVESPPEQP